MAQASKPFVIVCSSTIYGHMVPLRAIGKGLIDFGYDVTFITASAFRGIIEETGVSFLPLTGHADYVQEDMNERWPERNKIPPGPEQVAYDITQCFVNPMQGQYEALQSALEAYKAKDASRPVVVVAESGYMGSVPLKLDAPGLKASGTVSIGVFPLILSSIDLAPYGLGLPPDASLEGRQRNKAMLEHMRKMILGVPEKRFHDLLTEMGASQSPYFVQDAVVCHTDRYLQCCTPSMEYPRSDAPPHLSFTGGIPRIDSEAWTQRPLWWSEVDVNAAKKNIIFVCQGTLALEYSELIIPTLNGLKDMQNTLVIAALGRKGTALPASKPIPSNARVLDFIPFEHILPHASAFITNGGYGGVLHAISHGTPMIIAGISEDKPEVAARAEWAGVAVNLKTGTPAPEVVKKAVSEILENPKFKIRAMEIAEETKTYNPMEIIAQNIEEVAAGKPLKEKN